MISTPTVPEIDLVLASASPRRKDLLESLGVRFLVVPSAVDEDLFNGESPAAHVRRLARDKATDVSDIFPEHWVLGADTIVVIDGRILGKPVDRAHAAEMLSRLAGRTHKVFTGYYLVNSMFPQKARLRHVCSGVRIRPLSMEQISSYIDTGEPMDKAGAYAIQGIGSGIVARVAGSYTNVVGLPLCEVARDLQELRVYDFLTGARSR